MWREIEGFDGRYEVSDQGEIRVSRTSKASHVGRIMKQRLNRLGYLCVQLWDGERYLTVRVHRAVAKAFLGDPGEGHVVCHSDGNKQNNAAANLRWDTQANNNRDMPLHGTHHNRNKTHHNRNKTHCPKGHKYTDENTYWNKGKDGRRTRRTCRECGRAATRRYLARRRAEA